MKEIFKVIPSFPDYLVSNFGRVKTTARLLRYTHSITKKEHFRKTTERFMKVQYNNRTGYKFYSLYLGKKMYNKTIHTLVADAFLPNNPMFECINHKDGNKHNNCVENLERCTNEYNHEHATRTGLRPRGESVNSAVLNENCVLAIRHFLKEGYSHSKLGVIFNVSRPTITHISNNHTWSHVTSIDDASSNP